MAFVFGVRFRFNSAYDTLFRRAIGISNSFVLIIVLNVSRWGNNRLQILKYAPINTQNIGFIIENIEQNTLFINVQVLIHSLLNSLTKFENRPYSALCEQQLLNRSQISSNIQ